MNNKLVVNVYFFTIYLLFISMDIIITRKTPLNIKRIFVLIFLHTVRKIHFHINVYAVFKKRTKCA